MSLLFVQMKSISKLFFLNSSLINTLYFDNKTKLPNNMRRIDWERGRPYTFTNKDFF